MDHGATLLTIFVAYMAAIIGGEIAMRLKMPSVVGQIFGGIVVGKSMLGWVGGEPNSIVYDLGELGAAFLLFSVGLETPFEKIGKVGKEAMVVAILGVIFPFVIGFAWAHFSGFPNNQAAFVAAAFIATSAGITAKVLQELGVIDRTYSQVILGAAVIDDVLAMLVLTIVSALSTGQGVNILSIAIVIVQSLGFIVLMATFGRRFARKNSRMLDKPMSPLSIWSLSIALCIGVAVLANKLGLAAIIGAFLVGTVLAETDYKEWIHEKVIDLNEFIVPFFFISAGLNVDIMAFNNFGAIGNLLLVSVLAIAGKYVGAWLGAKENRKVVGMGMVPRGEVGIIVAGLGFQFKVIGKDIYSLLVGMSLLTSVVAAPILKWFVRDDKVSAIPSDSA
ncbi:MAG: cation:proton antiporter [Armatimonadetes bacterium]|nr:cation:proton antiporter [Armatimonadota bacterium]